METERNHISKTSFCPKTGKWSPPPQKTKQNKTGKWQNWDWNLGLCYWSICALNCYAIFSQGCRKFISSGLTLHAAPLPLPPFRVRAVLSAAWLLREAFGFKLLFKPKVQFLRLQNRNLERIAYWWGMHVSEVCVISLLFSKLFHAFLLILDNYPSVWSWHAGRLCDRAAAPRLRACQFSPGDPAHHAPLTSPTMYFLFPGFVVQVLLPGTLFSTPLLSVHSPFSS